VLLRRYQERQLYALSALGLDAVRATFAASETPRLRRACSAITPGSGWTVREATAWDG